MAKDLNLDATWVDSENLRVSWTDVQANDNNKAMSIILPIVIFVFVLIGIFNGISGGGFGMMGFALLFAFGSVFWFRSGSTSKPNQITFNAKTISHQGLEFPTAQVTRFEYGSKSQLTGWKPMKDGKGNPMSDPTLIRMWVNDSSAHTISENNWQTQVNHKIRDTLDKALIAVRDVQKKEAHEAEFGDTSGDFGMPDY
jgi:hypothetical protein